jgi:hypothetical protein
VLVVSYVLWSLTAAVAQPRPLLASVLSVLSAIVFSGGLLLLPQLLADVLKEFVRAWYGDDPFTPQLDTVILPLPAGVTAEQHVLTMESTQRSGRYRLNLEWTWGRSSAAE